MKNDPNHEPDVTPLINVNLVILVMALLVASHAALLLPLTLPAAAKTTYVETKAATVLSVSKDSTYSLDGQRPLTRDALAEAISGFRPGQVITLDLEPGVKFESLAHAIDCLMKVPDLRVGLGRTGARPEPRPAAASAPAGEGTP